MLSRGGNRAARYHTTLGSAQETLACLEAAEALSSAAPASIEETLHSELKKAHTSSGTQVHRQLSEQVIPGFMHLL